MTNQIGEQVIPKRDKCSDGNRWTYVIEKIKYVEGDGGQRAASYNQWT